jgi:hypothetical protein
MSENDTDLRMIREHCGDIAGRIRACRSRMIALQLKEQLCGELAGSCASPVVQNMLQNHVDQLINVTFDENGMNRYLEE